MAHVGRNTFLWIVILPVLIPLVALIFLLCLVDRHGYAGVKRAWKEEF